MSGTCNERSRLRQAFRRRIMNLQREFLQRNMPENWAAFAASNFYSVLTGESAVHSSLQLFRFSGRSTRILSNRNIIIHISR